MRRILLGVVAVAAIGLCFFIAWLNPSVVEFRFWMGQSIALQLGWLLIFTFLAGALATTFAVSLQQLGRRVSGWRERRQVRREERAGGWRESGAALAWDGDLNRGRMLLRKAWRSRPESGAAALALAASYADTGEYPAARQVLEEAVRQDPHDPDLRYALGEVLRRSGSLDEAIRMLETVRVQHPRAPRALVALRELYEQRRSWADAARVQTAYLESLTDGERAAVERHRLVHFRYQATMEIADAAARAEALNAIVQSERSFFPAVVSLGDALLAAQRGEEAKKHWERAFRAAPRLVLIERLLAQAGEGRERQRVVALLEKHRPQLDPDAVRLLLARIALERDDVDASANELQEVSRQDSPAVHRFWAEIHQRRGQSAEALRNLARIVDSTAPLNAYRCSACGHTSREWTGYCPACNRWDSYRAGLEAGTA
jgi:lipopolysaccharide biosynthesis regulator YciM